jgi:hypothetical protein
VVQVELVREKLLFKLLSVLVVSFHFGYVLIEIKLIINLK